MRRPRSEASANWSLEPKAPSAKPGKLKPTPPTWSFTIGDAARAAAWMIAGAAAVSFVQGLLG